MNDLVEIVGLTSLLKQHNCDSTNNFENIYANITDTNLRNKIEEKINNYFDQLSLPKHATLYDRLLLSLRKKDAIFTFNWEPYLFDAYVRNNWVAPLPGIFFLHGNVRIGSCEIHHDQFGRRGGRCPCCNRQFVDVPLLYPIKDKDYFNENTYTKSSWTDAMFEFTNAFTITIFGYSAPDSDVEAVNLLKAAWLHGGTREFEHIEIIDVLDVGTITERWRPFAPTLHLSSVSSFEESRIWRWPRRSCETLFYPMSQGIPCEAFPLSEINDLNELQNAIAEIARFEQ